MIGLFFVLISALCLSVGVRSQKRDPVLSSVAYTIAATLWSVFAIVAFVWMTQ